MMLTGTSNGERQGEFAGWRVVQISFLQANEEAMDEDFILHVESGYR
jgi:hypothetical protein